MLAWHSAKMFVRASWKQVSKLETQSVCSKLPRPLECHNSICKHQCSIPLASSQDSFRRPADEVCHSLPKVVCLFLVHKLVVLANILVASHLSKAVAASLALNNFLLTCMAFPVSSLRELPMVNRVARNSWQLCSRHRLLLLSPVAVVAPVPVDQCKVCRECPQIWLVCKALANQVCLDSLRDLGKLACLVAVLKAVDQVSSQVVSLPKLVGVYLPRFLA